MSCCDVKHWSRFAAEWIRWARSPNEAFWAYRASLMAFIGQGTGDALDVGCGEGRVSRVLKECGFRVTATDPVEHLLSAARSAHSAACYKLAPATALPFPDGRFDLVTAYNILMDLDDLRPALHEIRRVLRLSGTLVISVVHPFTDRGRFVGPEDNSVFLVDGCYFGRQRFEGVETCAGLQMHFAGWSLPLEGYVGALADAGFAVISVREPVPEVGKEWGALRRWEKVPLFLWLKAARLQAGSPDIPANG